MFPRRPALLVSLFVGLACVVTAMAVAVLAPPVPDAPAMPESMKVEAFRYIAAQEAEMRDGTKNSYPGDAWSQDDQFYGGINGRVFEFSQQKNVTRSDIFLALDEGLRQRWEVPDGGPPLRATIAPCRPRPIY